MTLVAWQRECLFGEIVNGEMKLNNVGQIIQWEWQNLPQRFGFVELGAFVIMPNHFHGIIVFHENVGATRQGLTDVRAGNASLPNVSIESLDGSPLPRGPKPASLGAIISQFKSRATKRLWKIPSLTRTPIWQRNYYEHIIRNEREMDGIWRYLESNPSVWVDDDENPLCSKL